MADIGILCFVFIPKMNFQKKGLPAGVGVAESINRQSMNRAITRRSERFSLRGVRDPMMSFDRSSENSFPGMGSRYHNREEPLSESSGDRGGSGDLPERIAAPAEHLQSIDEMCSGLTSDNATLMSAKESFQSRPQESQNTQVERMGRDKEKGKAMNGPVQSHRTVSTCAAAPKSSALAVAIICALAGLKTATASSPSSVFENLGPSIAASTSHGTVVAVPCHVEESDSDDVSTNNSILILTRTPNKLNSPSEPTTTTSMQLQQIGDVSVVPQNTLSSSGLLHMPSWNIIDESTVVCMTGFLPEVHLVTRILEEIIDNQQTVLASDGFLRTPPAVELIQTLASQFQGLALSTSSRPLGVSVLMVGRSSRGSRWHVWTLDPAGNLRSGPFGVIGKNFRVMEQKLQKQITLKSPRETLIKLIHTTKELFSEDDSSSALTGRHELSDKFEALLLFCGPDSIQAGRVSEKDLMECLQAASV
jgi:20S proteasome alpha/beta subunit